MINMLNPEEKIDLVDPKRPNVAFDAFVTAMSRQIGAALEIPSDLLLKSFNASYSASRGALLEAWKMFRCSRQWVAKEFCQPVFEQWLSEAVSIGRIQAPGFFVDPIIKAAWCGSEWHGPSQGQLDPLKEIQAADMRIMLGTSTRQRESVEINGSDFEHNIKELGREMQLMNTYRVPTTSPAAMPPFNLPAPGAAPAKGGEQD
jgi:capsid protein